MLIYARRGESVFCQCAVQLVSFSVHRIKARTALYPIGKGPAIDNLSKCIRLCSHSGPAHSPSFNTRHKTARPSHCGRAACLPSNVLQIPSSPIPTHPHVKSNVSAVMRAGAGAAEHPLRSFPEGSGGAVHALLSRLPPSPPLNRPSTPPQCLPIPVPTQPLLSELNGDRHGDPRRS